MLKEILQAIKELFKFDKSPKEATRELLRGLPKKSSRKLSDADPKLQTAFRLIREQYRLKRPGYTLVLTDVFRHPKKQKAIYEQGRTKPGKIVTYADGYKKKGKHNYYPSKALDAAVKDPYLNSITWAVSLYKPLGKIIKKVSKETGIKLEWGGDWKKLKDMPHIGLK